MKRSHKSEEISSQELDLITLILYHQGAVRLRPHDESAWLRLADISDVSSSERGASGAQAERKAEVLSLAHMHMCMPPMHMDTDVQMCLRTHTHRDTDMHMCAWPPVAQRRECQWHIYSLPHPPNPDPVGPQP